MKKRIDKFMLSTSAQPVGGTTEQPMMITAPLVIMFEQDDKIVCHLHPRQQDNYRHYGLLICDLVRHVANAFKVDEDDGGSIRNAITTQRISRSHHDYLSHHSARQGGR